MDCSKLISFGITQLINCLSVHRIIGSFEEIAANFAQEVEFNITLSQFSFRSEVVT